MTARNGIVCVEWQGPTDLAQFMRDWPRYSDPSSCVYIIADEAGPIYVGSTIRSLRDRFADHFTNHRTDAGALVRAVCAGERHATIQWIEVASIPHVLEAQVVRAEQPPMNKNYRGVPGLRRAA